jgi:hypothetical protein
VLTHYETHIKPTVDADPEVVAAKARVDKLWQDLLTAQGQLINAKNKVIARCVDTQQSGS